MKKLSILAVIALCLVVSGCKKELPQDQTQAINLVSSVVYVHALDVKEDDLKVKYNPNGAGIFVYTKKDDPRGIEQKALWIVFKGEVFPLNNIAKEITPGLKWPIEVMPSDWALTGFNVYSYHKPMQWIFG